MQTGHGPWTLGVRCVALFGITLAAGCDAAANSARGVDVDASPDAGSLGGPVALPPPISGGTLLVTRDGLWAVASLPDTDRVAIVGLSNETPGCPDCEAQPKVMSTIDLAPGQEPGRLAEDGVGRVHVVLRRGGAIATIDLATGTLLARRPVCAAPRGIAYDPASDLVHVACASGELVSLSPLSGNVQRRIAIDVDLRDVVVVPDGLVVSRFKTAELIRLDHDGNIVARVEPQPIERGSMNFSDLTSDPMAPGVAWRTIGTATGSIFMLHQYGLARAIDVGEAGATTPTPYAAAATSSCGGIVAPTVSAMSPTGDLAMGLPLPVEALSVDVAPSTDGAWLAVAHAGVRGVTIYGSADLPTLDRSPVSCAPMTGSVVAGGQPVAVAMYPGRVPAAASDSDWLLVQTRAPSELFFYRGFSLPHVSVDLDLTDTKNPGHDLFHFDSSMSGLDALGRGIACAQCHPEGGEDGRVWQFLPIGNRRTQAVNVGLEGTAPFHWSGDLANMEALVTDTFVRRMGGAMPSEGVIEALRDWLFSLTPPAPIVDPENEAAKRGRALFESTEVGCKNCHDGPRVAKNTNQDVGVESPNAFQIPSLRGVGYRAPYLHNGCAATLRDRFDPACGGGDNHGRTSQLSPAQIDDLIAYLQSL